GLPRRANGRPRGSRYTKSTLPTPRTSRPSPPPRSSASTGRPPKAADRSSLRNAIIMEVWMRIAKKVISTTREEGDFGLADLADEAWRPAAELGLLLVEPVFWGVGVRRGDGRPVLVLPGLYGGDRYLSPLRDWLRRIGYSP